MYGQIFFVGIGFEGHCSHANILGMGVHQHFVHVLVGHARVHNILDNQHALSGQVLVQAYQFLYFVGGGGAAIGRELDAGNAAGHGQLFHQLHGKNNGTVQGDQ